MSEQPHTQDVSDSSSKQPHTQDVSDSSSQQPHTQDVSDSSSQQPHTQDVSDSSLQDVSNYFSQQPHLLSVPYPFSQKPHMLSLPHPFSPQPHMLSVPHPFSQQPHTPGVPHTSPSQPHTPGVPHPSSSQPQANVSPSPETTQKTDPIAIAKSLILCDLRRSILEVNMSAEKVVQRSLGIGGEEKRLTVPSSSSNPLSGNPQSVQSVKSSGIGGEEKRLTVPSSISNPLSGNPQSVQSVTSVKSTDERMSLGEDSSNPMDTYNAAMNKFLNTCDEIEKNLKVAFDVQRQRPKFDLTPQDDNQSTSQLTQQRVAEMNKNKQLLKQNIDKVAELQKRLKTKKSNNSGS